MNLAFCFEGYIHKLADLFCKLILKSCKHWKFERLMVRKDLFFR